MKKESKSLFKYEIPLKFHSGLQKRFTMAQDIYNASIHEIKRRDKKRRKDPLFKKAYKLDKGKERNQILKELDKKYDISDFSLRKYANDFRNKKGYAPYIPSDVAIKLGARAWLAFEKVHYAKGATRIHYNDELTSFEAKSDSGIIIRNGLLKMGTKGHQLTTPVLFHNDDFEHEVFRNTFKYNAIVRKKVNGKWHYYVQQTWEGTPPQKYTSDLKTAVGIDIGTSIIATSSYYQTELRELAQGVDDYQAEIRRLQRKLDRQRRANNPQNYNEDGTIKKGRKTWTDSKSYIKTRNRLANLKRKQKDTRELAHKTLANEFVTMGDSFIVEQMSFDKLQQNDFGKTLAHRAPAKLIEIMKYKAAFQGKPFMVANTYKLRASQLDHSTGEYTKRTLSDRVKFVDDKLVQRDLYSAFLLQHTNKDGETIDLDACQDDFDNFLRNQDETMRHLDTDHSSTGKKDFDKYLQNQDKTTS